MSTVEVPSAIEAAKRRATELRMQFNAYLRAVLVREQSSLFLDDVNLPSAWWESEPPCRHAMRLRREIWEGATARAKVLKIPLWRYTEDAARWESFFRRAARDQLYFTRGSSHV